MPVRTFGTRMPRNRVQELEVTVEELEATVMGLTEELVEVKRRLRDLEGTDAVEAEPSRRPDPTAETSDIIIC